MTIYIYNKIRVHCSAVTWLLSISKHCGSRYRVVAAACYVKIRGENSCRDTPRVSANEMRLPWYDSPTMDIVILRTHAMRPYKSYCQGKSDGSISELNTKKLRKTPINTD